MGAGAWAEWLGLDGSRGLEHWLGLCSKVE